MGTLDKRKLSEPLDSDCRLFVRSGSRKLSWNTNFTSFGDKTTATQEIFGGKELRWDFGNSTDDITPPTNFKKKRIEFKFIDEVQIKEGSIYFMNAPKGSFIEFMIVCPSGGYYYDNSNTLKQASSDTAIQKFVKVGMVGDCPMGDELNAEEASDVIPNTYKFWIDITVPDETGYTDCYGHIEVEMNRLRSIIL